MTNSVTVDAAELGELVEAIEALEKSGVLLSGGLGPDRLSALRKLFRAALPFVNRRRTLKGQLAVLIEGMNTISAIDPGLSDPTRSERYRDLCNRAGSIECDLGF